MTDIVERLRAIGREYWQHKPHYEEAAEEIERLQAALTEAFEALNATEWSRAAAIIHRALEPKP